MRSETSPWRRADIAAPLYDDDPSRRLAAVRGLADLIQLRIHCFVDPRCNTCAPYRASLRAAGSPPLVATVRWQQRAARGALRRAAPGELSSGHALSTRSTSSYARRFRGAVIDMARRHAKPASRPSTDSLGCPPFTTWRCLPTKPTWRARTSSRWRRRRRIWPTCGGSSIHTLRHSRPRPRHHRPRRDRGRLRLVFPLAGSLFTFAYLTARRAGPGQLPLREMRAEIDKYFPQ